MKMLKKIILIFVLIISFGSFGISAGAPDPSDIVPLDGDTTPRGNSDTSTLPALDAGGLSERMGNPAHSANNGEDLSNKLGVNTGDNGTGILTQIIKFARESIFNLLWVVVVGVLLYIGFRLIIGRGTPDIFKKAIMGLIYLIIGIVLIFTSWAMIKIILGVQI